MSNDEKRERATPPREWRRIPNGIKVRHRLEGYDGTIDGLTEIVQGLGRNPDGRTQYRVDVGQPERRLAAEGDLLFIASSDGLVMIDKANSEYRGYVTEQLRGIFADDRFVVGA